MENVSKIHESILAFQAEFKGIEGEKKSGMRNDYYPIDMLIAKVKPILNKHDLYLTQIVIKVDSEWVLQTKIVHKDGGYINDDGIPLYNDEKGQNSKNQSMGASITYNRRYGLQNILGLAEYVEDLDSVSESKSKTYRNDEQNIAEENAINVGDIFKKHYPDLYEKVSECEGKLNKYLMKICVDIKNKYEPKEKWEKKLFEDYQAFVNNINQTTNG